MGKLQRAQAAGKQALWVSVAVLLVKCGAIVALAKGGEGGQGSQRMTNTRSRSRRPDPFQRGLLIGFLCAAVPAMVAFFLCLAFA